MREQLQGEIERFAHMWCQCHGVEYLWRQPIVRFADAADPSFAALKEVVDADHHLPADFLPEANVVISLFLPFVSRLAKENLDGVMAAQSWVDAYNQTNAMASELCEALAEWLQGRGFLAATVSDAGMIGLDNPRSRWSQRHVAYLAGQGTWGVNNMLISDAGCVGRYYSLVARLPMEAIRAFDLPQEQQRCLHKQGKKCLVCVKRCINGALGPDSFDRFKCLEQCLKNERELGADVCGKCIVGLPCSCY